MSNFSIDLNVNLPGLAPFLQLLKDHTMNIQEALAAVTASNASVADHVANLEASNKELILSNSVIVDALRALQLQPTITAASLQPILDANAAVIAGADAAKAAADAAAAIKP